MKIKNILTTALLAGVSMVVMSATASAITTANDDLILSFRQKSTNATGNGTNLEVDLGNINTFLANSSTFSLSLGTDLSSIYGSNWNSTSTMRWSVVGTNAGTPSVSGETNNTLYFTASGAVQAPDTDSAQSTVAGKLVNLTTFLGGQSANGATTVGGAEVANSGAGSYGKLAQNGGANTAAGQFGYFTTNGNGVEKSAVTALNGSTTFELYKNVPGASTSVDLGTFTLSVGANSGIATLTFAAAPIPEPSTYALMGLGSLGLFVWARRRKVAVLA